MSRGKRANGKDVEFSFKGFLSFPLNAEAKNHFRQWFAEGMSDEVDFDAILANGYKFSCSYYAGNGNYTASFTCVNPDLSDFGYALSAFGPDSSVARALLLYKHSILAEGDWRGSVGAVKADDDIG